MSQRELYRPLLVLIFLACCNAPVAADDVAELRAAALSDVRSAAAGRDMAAVKEKLAAAAKLKGQAAYDAELMRLDELCDYTQQFWQAVERGAEGAEGTQELEIGEQRVAVVEYAQGTLVLRVAGQNRRYTLREMPAKVALTLAQQVMQPNAPNNKVFFGAFLALDAKGDRAIARQMWQDAAAAGLDVKRLLPELDVPPVAPPIEIPPVTPAMKAQLQEKNWSLRTPGERVWVRKPLNAAAEQTPEGRLQVAVPADAGTQVQLVARRQFNGDFTCNLIVQGAKKSQTFGFFAADRGDEGFCVALPGGTVLLELSRQAGMVSCRVNGQATEVQTLGKPAGRMTGFIGLNVAVGDTLTIAAIELTGR